MNFRKKILKTLIILISILLIVPASHCFNNYYHNRNMYSDFGETLWHMSCSFGDYTEFSKNYSEVKFKKIEIGMPKEDVLTILGPPIRIERYRIRGSQIKDEKYREVWRYTIAPPNRNYWLRVVVINEKGLLLKHIENILSIRLSLTKIESLMISMS